MKKEDVIKKLEEELEGNGDYLADFSYDEKRLNIVKIVKHHGGKPEEKKSYEEPP